MAKLTLTDLTNLQNESTAVAAINANNAAIEAAIEATYTRSGTSPNQLTDVLDANSNRVINLPEPLSNTEPVRLGDLSNGADGLAVASQAQAEAGASNTTLMTPLQTKNAVQNGTLFTQTGTGATARTIPSKLKERVSVLDFGADPTGVADSATAFSSAASAVGTWGQIAVPAGTYRINSAVTSQKTWVLEGEVTFTGTSGAPTNCRGIKLGNGVALTTGGSLFGALADWFNPAFAALTGSGGRTTTGGGGLASLSHVGSIGMVGASRTSDYPIAGYAEATIGNAGFVINDATGANVRTGYAFYGDAYRASGAGNTFMYEGDIVNAGSLIDIAPHNMFVSGLTVNLWVASGGGFSSGVVDATAAIGIINNGAKYRKGIVFHQNALTGADGTTGTAEAISFGKGHYLQWYNSSGSITAAIQCTIATAANGTGITFDDNGFNVTRTGGNLLFQVAKQTSTTANYIQVIGVGTGSPSEIRAAGSDTNVGLILRVQGTERIGFFSDFTTSAPAAGGGGALPATPTGYLRVTINGSQRVIPYYPNV